MSRFTKAVRSLRKIHSAIDGPSGSGKTFTALRLAFSLVDSGMATRVAVIDSENNSSSLYAGESPDGRPWEFEVLNLRRFGPDDFSDAINAAVQEKFDAIVVDSLSHAWMGEGGALDIVDNKGGKFQAWKDVTPMHRRMIDTIIRCPAHIIATMRSKMEHVMEKDEKGMTTVRKVGLAPVQRDGMEYEFDIYGSMDVNHQIKITKSRCAVMDGRTTVKPGPEFWSPLLGWLKTAADKVESETPTSPPMATVGENGTTNGHAATIFSDLLSRADIVSNLEHLRQVAAEANDAAKIGKLSQEEIAQLKSKIGERKTALSKS